MISILMKLNIFLTYLSCTNENNLNFVIETDRGIWDERYFSYLIYRRECLKDLNFLIDSAINLIKDIKKEIDTVDLNVFQKNDLQIYELQQEKEKLDKTLRSAFDCIIKVNEKIRFINENFEFLDDSEKEKFNILKKEFINCQNRINSLNTYLIR
ncbi:hypothetical protein HERIO_1007 [Hepatospora eriocheir]|uniref:Uncharacterized protein n=1 Tax=Hepatospora eriocheir TaxID=1081669 RepID=A0A1X0QBL2_9MICR|nr:hypothetical protein HERIO_1007 [Hepatospora eriocheir]